MSTKGGIFLWHYPHDRSHWALSSSLIFMEARTFLKTCAQNILSLILRQISQPHAYSPLLPLCTKWLGSIKYKTKKRFGERSLPKCFWFLLNYLGKIQAKAAISMQK